MRSELPNHLGSNLWIDSLCIMQDSADDWVNEAELMSKVYRYGFVNIAATGARDGSQGCSWVRDLRKIISTECRIQWRGSAADKTQRYQVMPDHNVWAQKFVNEPLNTRCWVLQERILSPRMIHFGSNQLFWECRQAVAYETYHRGLPPSLRQNKLIDIKTVSLGDEPRNNRWSAKYESKTAPRGDTLIGKFLDRILDLFQPPIIQEVTLKAPMKTTSISQDWDAIVELYSLRDLTFSAHKLVALAGVASAMSDIQQDGAGDGYLAGLWQSSMPSHLLWRSEQYQRTVKGWMPPKVPKRYDRFVAPSWSWASIDGKVALAWCKHNYDANDYLAKLEEAEVNWVKSNARFGQVHSAWLKISGPLASALWEMHDDTTSVHPMVGHITHLFPRGHDRSRAVAVPTEPSAAHEILFDVVPDDPMEVLTLLPIIGITRTISHENGTTLGLVLQQHA